jgi:hypothetical protein
VSGTRATGAQAAVPALRTGEECWVGAAHRAMARTHTARVAATPTTATGRVREHLTSGVPGTVRRLRSGIGIA